MIDNGDTAWMLAATALVILMTPALGLFYAGLVRSKNGLNTFMMCIAALGVATIAWALIGYSLAFGDGGGFVGNLDHAFLRDVGFEPREGTTIPHLLFMAFQGSFCILTVALVSGAVVERIRFGPYLVFVALWAVLVYPVMAHWVFGGGFLAEGGTLDFAGGVPVEMASGFSALAAALVIGARKDYGRQALLPHNSVLVLLGAGLLWFGWFGFNAGSALSAGTLSTMAFVATHISAVSATLIWVIIEWMHRGKPTMFGAATGSIAGLATITPASGFVSPMSSLIIGLAAGAICYMSLNMKGKLGYDDSLDAFGVHGIGGIIGTLATGLFAQTLINPAGGNGLFFGSHQLLFHEITAIAVTAIYSFGITVVLLKGIDIFIGLRVNEESEVSGLDISQHGESGYSL